MCIWGTIEAGSRSHCCLEESVSITYTECVSVALVIERIMRMRHIVICGVCGSTIFSLLHLIHGTIFRKKSWFYLQNLSEILLIVRRNERDFIINVHRSYVKYPLILSDLNRTWIFSTPFEKYSNIKFHENPSKWEPSCSCRRTRGQTDTHGEANSRFFKILRSA